MHIKLLLACQLLALSCSQIWADHASVHSDEQTLDDVHVVETTTTLEELVPSNDATAHPDDGLLQLDESLAVESTGTVIPETTTQAIKTTPPTTTTSTPTAATTVATAKSQKIDPVHPQVYPHPYPNPHPYLHPHLHAHPYAHPYHNPYGTAPLSRESGPPGYPYPHVSILRSPYGVPVYSRGFPNFAPGLGYDHRSLNPDASEEKPNSKDEADESAKNKIEVSTEEGPKPPGDQRSFDYPPVYAIPRRQLLHSYPYGNPGPGYRMPYGYRR